MDIRDVRVGNLVLFYETETIFEVTDITPTGIGIKNNEEETWIEIDMFRGIPLTKEWAVRFGFKKVTDASYTKDNNWQIYFAQEHPIFRVVGRSLGICKTVHQLQNIIHSLTGMELKR